jgi:hypothetical protein
MSRMVTTWRIQAAVLATLVLVAAMLALAQPTTTRIVLRISFPDGTASKEIPVPDGDDGMIQFQDANDSRTYHTFYFAVDIRDRSAGSVTVVIRAAPERSAQALDTLELIAGGSAVSTNTNPSFEVTAIRIE